MNNQEYTAQFCNNIRILRERNSLSQRKMADQLGIGIYSLRMIEKGILPPRLDWLVVLRIHEQFHILPEKIFLPLDETE